MLMSKTGAPSLRGLTQSEVNISREKHGANLFTRQKRKSFFLRYLESFGDPIIKILLAALAVNVLLMLRTGELYETAGIAAAVFLSTFVSTLSEYGSESAFLQLQKEGEKLRCRVKREGKIAEIPIGEVVVGDIVILSAGERIPADGVLLSGELHVDQSSVNGESAEMLKMPSPIMPRWEPSNKGQLFRGTTVTSGEGVMQVMLVGDATVYGGMAGELQIDGVDSPMKTRLADLAKGISRLGYTAALLIAFADLFHAIVIDNHYIGAAILSELANVAAMAGNLMHAALLAISVIVVAVPEGLPMMIAVVLSSNMMRMQRDQVMVRKLVGIETAGSINILFTDKTGTLTTGALSVETVVTGDGRRFRSAKELERDPALARLFTLSAVCGGAAMLAEGRAVGGNSTERALLDFAAPLAKVYRGERCSGMPFSSAKKYSWARIAESGRETVLVKGAPEKLLPRCVCHYDKNGAVQSGIPAFVTAALSDMTKKAMRVLLIASCDGDFEEKSARLTLIALVGIRDSLRRGARSSVNTVRRAGIQTVMITGDNRETAVSVAREAGLLTDAPYELVLTGDELAAMSDDTLRDAIPSLRVVARALPTDKSRLVRLSQERGLVVGMTGDGVNDATALRRADVGFAMGSGTEVAKEACDIVILDDDLSSVARAVLYGRTIFHSIRKFIVFQLTMNFCAMCVSLIAPFIGIDTPVTVTQMLWINMIMDTLAGLAFAGEAPRASYMEEKPKKRSEPIVCREMAGQILITGGFTVVLCLLFLKLPALRSMFGGNPLDFMTAFFTLFVFCGIFNAFNARTERVRLTADLHRNPSFLLIMLLVSAVQILIVCFGGEMFRTHALSPLAIMRVLFIAFAVIPFDLLRKITDRLLSIRD